MSPLTLINDQPIGENNPFENEGLGFTTYAQVLGEAILNTATPFTIGVFGEWGTGKTSLMRMLEKNIHETAKDDAVLIWFNAWQYEKEENLIVPLIAHIINELEKQKTFLKAFEDGGKKIILALRAIAYGFSSKVKVSFPGVAEIETTVVGKDVIDREEKLAPKATLEKSLYYDAFETLSKIKIGKKKRIVIIIDDLDRCFPDKTIELLENIKLVLSQQGFIFVLGVSRYVIEGYLKYRYEELYGLKNFDGRSYFDKIVQLPFYIPPHDSRMKSFSNSILARLDEKNRESLEEMLDIIGSACKNNPRSIIRFVNNLLIDQAINKALVAEGIFDREIEIGYFAITRSLQQNWSDLFTELIESDQLCKAIAQLHEQGEIEAMAALGLNQATVELDIQKHMGDVARRMVSNKDLSSLLMSSVGKEWLLNDDLRRGAVEFLIKQRITNRLEVDVNDNVS